MIIDEQTKNLIKQIFKEVYSVKEQASDLTKSANEMKSNLAKQLQVKGEVVNKAYSEWEARVKKKDVMEEKDELLIQVFSSEGE